MKANRKFSKDEEAVSPVIGVILMVAITVILAAVIAAFVFGMGGSLKKNYIVAATMSQTGSDTADFTYQGGPDASSLIGIKIKIGTDYFDTNGNASTTVVYAFGSNTTTTPIPVGESMTLTEDAARDVITAGRDHVVVGGTFADGSEQVIMDTYI